MSRPAVALVGTGNFALNIEALLANFAIELTFCVDEFRAEPFQGVPVVRAADLSGEQIASVAKFIIAISNPQHHAAARERLIGQGVDKHQLITLTDDPAIQILRLLFEKFGQEAIDTFCSERCSSIPQLEELFLKQDWQQALAQFRPDRATIALCYYGRGGGFRRHLSPLVPHLETDYNLLTVSDELVGGDGELPGRHLYMSSESACRQALGDLVLSAHIFPCSPRETPRVTFSHVIYDFNLTPDYHAERIACSDTHYLFASSQPSFAWYQRLIEERQLKNRLCVIPGGYLHLDENIQAARAYTGPVDSLIYAPTLSLADYPHCDLATSLPDGPALCERLLEQFPDYKLIFRPHPSDLKLYQLSRADSRGAAFARLLEMCETHPRCVLDSNPTRYMASYNRAALMISDTSSTAMTYAFATGRPVVFYAPRNAELINTLGQELSFVKDRQQVGSVATSLDAVAAQVEQHLQMRTNQHFRTDFRDQVIFNVGRAGAYFAENIDYLLRGEKHPDWRYFNW